MYAKSLPQFADGKLYGCLIEFSTIAQDWAYKQGGFISVAGSFGVMATGGKYSTTLKVIINDIALPTLTTTPSPPASAFFVSKSWTSRERLVASSPSNIPGAIFVVFQPDVIEKVLKALENDRVDIVFNRKPGGADVPISIDTSVEETLPDGSKKRSMTATLEFLDCAQRVIGALK